MITRYPVLRSALAVALSASLAAAQQAVSIEPVRPSGRVYERPYTAVTVPEIRTGNSPRLASLIRAGALYLTAQDAIALALENNIDLEVARYGPVTSAWRLQRSEAGGALPGVPSAAAQAGAGAAGQGVSGSQSSAGVSNGGGGGNGGGNANASISQIGPVTQNLDPVFQQTSTFSHRSNPQPNSVQSVVQNLVSDTRAYQGSLQQGLLSGGLVRVQFTNNYLKENSPTNLLNPSTAQNLTLTAQHNLLRGFGIAVNARQITVSRMNLKTADLTFRNQVINLVASVLNSYYNLAGSHEDLRAKQNAAQVARTFLLNVHRQIELGAVAPPDAINAENLSVTASQAVVAAEASVKQSEVRLKNLLSRNGITDPELAAARIVPVDRIVLPAKDDLPAMEEMVKSAVASRADLRIQQINLEASQVSSLGTRNGLLPSLTAFATLNNAGLGGEGRRIQRGPNTFQEPDPYFVGGPGTALGQVFRRNFPTERGGAFFSATLRNRAAQADAAIDQLSQRQSELNAAKSQSQVQVAVMNYVIGLQQARARYESAVQNRKLQQQLFDSEEKKFALGASIPYNVIQQQRDLMTAQSSEVAALVSYSTARIALDQTLGSTLDATNVMIDEARSARVSRVSALPESAPASK